MMSSLVEERSSPLYVSSLELPDVTTDGMLLAPSPWTAGEDVRG